MMKRSATRSPEEFGSSSGKAVGEIEMTRVSDSGSHAEAAEAPSPSHVATSDFEPVDSPSRLTICRGACPPALSGALH